MPTKIRVQSFIRWILLLQSFISVVITTKKYYILTHLKTTYNFSPLSNMILLLFSPFEYQMIFRSKLCNRLDDIVWLFLF